MTYVISDIHGSADQFRQLKKKICFGGRDAMFVLGDIIDIGPDGLEILEEMSYAQNIWPVAGSMRSRPDGCFGSSPSCLHRARLPTPGLPLR